MTNLDSILLSKGYVFVQKKCTNRYKRDQFYYYFKEIGGIKVVYEVNKTHSQILDKYCLASKSSHLLDTYTKMQQEEYEKIKEVL